MPNYRYQFRAPKYLEQTIVDENGKVVGTIRIKPVSILWKPKGAQQFYSVPIDKFADWISADETKARKTKS